MARLTVHARVLAGAFAILPAASWSGARLHIALKRAEPAADSRLALAPTRIALWFTERPELVFSKIQLVGAAGDVSLGSVARDTGNGVWASIPAPLSGGAYRVVWQTAGADGHVLRGEFAFAVDGARADSVLMAPQGMGTQAPPSIPLTRWLEFLGLLVVLGVMAFRHAVIHSLAVRGVHTALASNRARLLGVIGAGVFAAAAVPRLLRQAADVGVSQAFDATIVAAILSSRWGVGWSMGFVGAVFVVVGLIVSKRSAALGTPLAVAGALAMAASPALSGHAATGTPYTLSVVTDIIHVIAAGGWIGGLLVLLVAGIPAMLAGPEGTRDAAVASLVNSFHPLALVCAPVVVLAGAGSAVMRLGSPAGLSSDYGRVLLLKVACVVAVAAMGAYNSMRARQRLGSPDGTRRFVRTATAELLLASLVLTVTTVLVALPAPNDMAP